MASPVAPTIDRSGISAPSFAQVLQYLQDQYRAIYGADVYLGNDSQDGQFIGIIAAAINDVNSAAVAVFNSFSPNTAQGNGLSSNVKLNGIKRLVPTNSTADVLVVGVANTIINNGVVLDVNGNRWILPAIVTIPESGSILVTAICQAQGAITVLPGSISIIDTPTFGWQSVSNPEASVAGQPVESDAQLRVRQARSVATPSLTVFEGIIGAVSNIPGVARIVGYENDTDTTDENGLPPHSIAVVVEGGDATTIAQTIADKKTPGTGTVGDVISTVIDSVGSPHRIGFLRPDQTSIVVNIALEPLPGYSVNINASIKQAVADFLNALRIGQKVIYSKLFVPANLGNVGFGATYNITSITVAKIGFTPQMADVEIAFDEVAVGDIANVNITVV